MVAGDGAFYAVGRPVAAVTPEEPALLAGDAFIGQALVLEEFIGVSGRAVLSQIGGAGGDAKALGGEDACLHAGIVEHADAKQQVGAVLQGVDVGVGLLDIQLQLRVAAAQLAEPR